MENFKNTTVSFNDPFTQDKTPELAIFYNIAYFKTAGLLHYLIEKTIENDKAKLENSLKSFISDPSKLTDAGYSKMRDYLWKGYRRNKNTSPYAITNNDKDLINDTIQKLNDLRNFQSHIWHDYKPLMFTPHLKNHIIELHDWALNQQKEKQNNNIKAYDDALKIHPLFIQEKEQELLSPEGKNFFLSFFLTTGEMSRFMKQRRGCKRDDKPEFKIKYQVYKHYTHRDGATRNHYGFENNLINELPEKEEILKVRQAYKIITYLNDVPQEVIDPLLFPFYNDDNHSPILKAPEYLHLINTLGILPGIHFFLLKSNKKDDTPKDLDFTLGFELEEDTRWQFTMNTRHLHQLLLNTLRLASYPDKLGNDIPYTLYIQQCLKQFIAERDRFIHIIQSGSTEIENPEEEQKLLTDYYVYKHRSTDKIRCKLGSWLDRWEMKKAMNSKAQLNLLECLNKEEAPIKLKFYDFYFEQDEKPRSDDMFVPYAVHYFIDFKIIPGLTWKTERLLPEEHELDNSYKDAQPENYFETIPQGHRLQLNNGHAIANYKGVKIALGYRALQNLLIAHFDKKELTPFFDALSRDLNQMKSTEMIDTNSFSLLSSGPHPKVMPLFMRRICGDETLRLNLFEISQKAKNRIAALILTLQEMLDQAANAELHMNRSEKNRQIMRCYRLFEWKYPQNNDYKFLRKDEYQWMSIFHYSLDPDPDPNDKHSSSEQQKTGLYNEMIKANGIEAHLPSEISQLLKNATSFDDLFIRTLKLSILRLKKWLNRFSSMSPDQRNTCLSRLGFSLNLTAPIEKANSQNNKLLSHIPYELHPLLPVNFFYLPELEESQGRFSLAGKVRSDPKFTEGLHLRHYDIQSYLDKFSTPALTRKIVGKLNSLLTLDALLWKIARQYLKNTEKKFSELNFEKSMTSVRNLRNTQLRIIPDPNLPHILVKLHQLNDFMFIESKPMLGMIVKYYLKRVKSNDKENNNNLDHYEDIKELDYNEVHTELFRIYQESLCWIGILLNWERNIVNNKITEEQKQKKIQESKAKKRYAYFDFNDIYKYAGNDSSIIKLTIKELRNKAMHVGIPEDWTYQELQKKPEITKLLDISPANFEKRKFYE